MLGATLPFSSGQDSGPLTAEEVGKVVGEGRTFSAMREGLYELTVVRVDMRRPAPFRAQQLIELPRNHQDSMVRALVYLHPEVAKMVSVPQLLVRLV